MGAAPDLSARAYSLVNWKRPREYNRCNSPLSMLCLGILRNYTSGSRRRRRSSWLSTAALIPAASSLPPSSDSVTAALIRSVYIAFACIIAVYLQQHPNFVAIANGCQLRMQKQLYCIAYAIASGDPHNTYLYKYGEVMSGKPEKPSHSQSLLVLCTLPAASTINLCLLIQYDGFPSEHLHH